MLKTTNLQNPNKIYHAYGAVADLWYCRDREVLLCGPAGTGKSRGELEYLNNQCIEHPGIRGLMCRRTRKSLTQSVMVEFEKKVIPGNHKRDRAKFHTGDQEYRYPNGSVIVVGGLDDSQKVMSSQYDLIYINEATEISEDDFQDLTTRLRNEQMPWQQLIADCNPSYPTHWLKKRCDSGKTQMFYSRHQDNPRLWDDEREYWTEAGLRYMSVLDALSGVRRLRLRDGIWAAAEGMIYPEWDDNIHIIQSFEIPKDWRRYLVVDFGYTNPFVAQFWAQDTDGRLYCTKELIGVRRLVEDWAEDIAREIKDIHLTEIIADHDAEGRATLERKLGIPTTAAKKAVTEGIQALKGRLKVQPDGKPRLFYFADALEERQPMMEDLKMPIGLPEELPGYVYKKTSAGFDKEEPVKEADHSMDAARYMCAHLDLVNHELVIGGWI